MLPPTYCMEGKKLMVTYQAFFPIRVYENIKMVLRKSLSSVSDIILHFMIVRWSTCVREYVAQ